MKPYKLAKGEEKYWLRVAKKVQRDIDNKRADVLHLKKYRDIAHHIN